MLIVMKRDAPRADVERVKEKIIAMGFSPHEIPGEGRMAIGITGNRGKLDPDTFLYLPGVLEAIPVSKAYKLVSREVKPDTR